MSTPDWNQIETALKAQDRPTPGRDSEAFWSEFRARAELMGQDRSPAPVLTAPRVWGASMAMAATFALLFGIAWMVMRPTVQPPTAFAANEIKDLRVTNPNVGVMVYAADSGGTILWITDAPPAENAPPSPEPATTPTEPVLTLPTVTTPSNPEPADDRP